MQMSKHYRFYLQRGDQTFAAEVLECADDGAAMEMAKDLLAASMTFHGIEVWQGTRKVGDHKRGSERPAS